MEYGVQTHNKFAFLDEDVSDPEEALIKAEEEKKKAAAIPQQKKVQPKIAKPPVVPVKEVPAKKHPENERKDDSTGDPHTKSVKFNNRTDRIGTGNREAGRDQGTENKGGGPRPPRQPPRRPPFNAQRENTEVISAGEKDNKRAPSDRPRFENRGDGAEGRPPRRGPGGPPRGGGGGRRGYHQGGGGGPPRQQTTEAGENNKPVDEAKPKNDDDWGNTEDWGQNVGTEQQEPPQPKETNDENVVTAEEDGKKEEGENEEQAPRGKTYEEWKAEMGQKNAAAEIQFNTRKPGEGADQKIYQKLVPLKKEDKKVDKSEEAQQEENIQHKEKREKTLAIDVAFVDKRSNFGNRRDFGERNAGGPGGGGRGLPREGGAGGGDRQGGGGRGFGSGGPREGGPRNFAGPGGPGPSSRRPPGGKPNQSGSGFQLENEQFPALGAAH